MAEKAKAEGNNFVKKLLSSNLTWSIVAFILLVIICTIFQHDFLALSWNSNTGGLAGPLITMLQESARYLMIATGMTLVISTAGIDLSVGSVMAVAGAAAMQTLSNGMNVWLSILIALAVGLAIGCVNGALVSFLGLQPFITTLIMMLAGRGMAKVITSGENTDASAVAGNEPLKWFANGFILGIPANFVIAVIIVILVGLLCRKTAMGMMIEAVGINQEASRMTGIKPKKILFLVYAISGFLAAIAGLFATASVMRVDVVKTGQDLEMYAILAVVIGGTSLLGGKFSLAGSAVGAVIIAMIRKTIITLGVNAEATPAFFAVVVIVICAVVIFILMIIMGQALFGTYIRLGFISSLFIDHAYLIILAVAMTLPILTGGIDLSVGAIVAITAVVGLKLANAGVPAFLVMIIMLLIGAVFGLLAGTLIEEFNMQPFIATLSTMFLARGLASIISTDSLTFPQGNDFSFISNVIKIIDNPKISNDLSFNVGVIIALVVVVFGYVFLHHTRTGRTIYAIGGSRSSAELMGLPVKRTQYIIYLTSATLAALASIVYTANIGSAKNTVGVGWELDAVASVVIGGTIITGGFGYVLGSVLGSLVRSILDPLTSDFGVPAEWTTIVIGLMILVFVVLQRAVMAVGGDKK